MLELPCIALLLLVQPDILRRVFKNERLTIGGFLARCLCADSKLMSWRTRSPDDDYLDGYRHRA